MTMQYIDDIIMINIEKLEMLGQHKKRRPDEFHSFALKGTQLGHFCTFQ